MATPASFDWKPITIKPIAVVHSSYVEQAAPKRYVDFSLQEATLEFRCNGFLYCRFFNEYLCVNREELQEALKGLDKYKSLLVLFHFNKCESEKLSVRPSRYGPDAPIRGVFATCCPGRYVLHLCISALTC